MIRAHNTNKDLIKGFLVFISTMILLACSNPSDVSEVLIADGVTEGDQGNYIICLLRTDGTYYFDEEIGPFLGNNWTGKYKLVLSNENGIILSEY